jgi:hypothetical protein
LKDRIAVCETGEAGDHVGMALEFFGGRLDEAVTEEEGVEGIG